MNHARSSRRPAWPLVIAIFFAVVLRAQTIGAAQQPAAAQQPPATAAPAPAGTVATTATTGALAGNVSAQSGTIALGGVRVILFRGSSEAAALISEADGKFKVENLQPGTYRVTALLEGFQPIAATVVIRAGQTATVALDLQLAETILVSAPVNVVPSAGTISGSNAVTQEELDQIAPGGGLQAALRLLVSVIEVPGGLAIKGGRPSQAGVQLGPGMFVDPATGLTQASLPDDAIDSVTVLPNPYAVEFGRFSSGLVVIQTRRATDTWKVRLNRLEPAFRTRRGEPLGITGISSFSPRIEIGGPLVKDRLFVQHSAQYRYRTNDVPSRPENELRTSHRFSSFTRMDANLSPRHSLLAVGGTFPSRSSLATLGTFTPPEATVDLRGRVDAIAVTERALWSETVFSETTAEMNRYHARVQPQGANPMELLPETTLGNFFNRQERMTTTYQLVQTVTGTRNGRGGLHMYKAGFDVVHSRFDGESESAPVLIRRTDQTLARRLDYGPGGTQAIRSTDLAFFAQDRVQPNSRWYIEFGTRVDRDGVVGRFNVTPRIGTAVLLNRSGTAVIRSGFGLFYERTPSAAGVFEQYESATETRYAADGVTPSGPPMLFRHVTDPDLETSRSATWDLAYDHRFSPRWAIRVGAIDRRGSHELLVDRVANSADSLLLLHSSGRSTYRELETSVHFTGGSGLDLNVSYVRSQARADLNAFTTFFDSVLAPVFGENAYAPARADAPHRVLARGRAMPTRNWLLVGVLDWRSGLPYSIVNESLDFVGPRNTERFPHYFRLDAGIEHRFKIFKYRPWIGIRADNALDSFLPSDVQANRSSPLFGTFYNSEYRQFRIQVRFER